MVLNGVVTPYCGLAPVPSTLWSRWNLDPVLLTSLVAILVVYLVGNARMRGSAAELWSFVGGWVVGSLALISPLCAMSVALFSARVGQHMVLALVAAPLIAFGKPWARFEALFSNAIPSERTGDPRPQREATLAAGAFVLALWLWHAPMFYAATFSSSTIYWMMHVTLFGSAFWVWRMLLGKGLDLMSRLVVEIAITVQMGLLGALLTFAPRVLFGEHLLTTGAWGLSALEDQQLGGLIMWIPGCGAFIVAMLISGAAAVGTDSAAVGRAKA